MKKLALVVLACISASACATLPKLDAAADIHAFMVSIRDTDRAAFEAHVDRPALKAQLRSRLMAEAAKSSSAGAGSLNALGAFLAGPLVDVAADALLRPEVFRAIAENKGYSPAQPLPSVIGIAQFVRPLGSGAVCVVQKKDGPCLLDFQNDNGTYRLTGFEGDLSILRGRRAG